MFRALEIKDRINQAGIYPNYLASNSFRNIFKVIYHAVEDCEVSEDVQGELILIVLIFKFELLN